MVLWKIIVGGILILISVGNLPMYLKNSVQAMTGLALSILLIFVGFWLVYRGFYPKK
jgi:hypothetical protein